VKAPFPYFGGKSKVAHVVWERFGNVRNYVEPFCGSAAVLLARPAGFSGSETINDWDGYVSNFWRAITLDPDEVLKHCDYPVLELDLHARSSRMLGMREEFTEKMRADPDFYDARIAGWWVWGVSAAIGDTFEKGHKSIPYITPRRSRGIHAYDAPNTISLLFERLRRVKVCCGDWSRVCTDIQINYGPTAVFLDPPYPEGDYGYGTASRSEGAPERTISGDVLTWCLANGQNPLWRIAMCGYSENDALADAGWSAYEWETNGGYSRTAGQKNANASREVIWFSPNCLTQSQGGLF
jgi:DNA adenine methylase